MLSRSQKFQNAKVDERSVKAAEPVVFGWIKGIGAFQRF